MNKIFVLMIIFLASGIWSSCAGTRQVDKQRSESSNVSKIETTDKAVEEKAELKSIQESGVYENAKVDRSNSNTENHSENSKVENAVKTTKKTTYYENGNKKSEEEISESLNKVSAEKEYWKTTSESLKEENARLIQNIVISEQKISNLKSRKDLQSESKETQKNGAQSSKREFESIWLYLLLYLLGLATVPAVKLILKK